MIIWGTKGKTKTVDKGFFYCPICNSRKPYHRKVLGKHFTLYFIPLFRTKKIAEFIECQNCSMTFKPEVLDWSKGHAQAKNDIQMIIDEMKKQLKAGMPAQTIVLGLTDSGVEKEDAARLLVEATNNRFSKCNQCNLDFISSLTYCPQCGNKMILHSY